MLTSSANLSPRGSFSEAAATSLKVFQAILLMIGLILLEQLGGWFERLSGSETMPIMPVAGLAFAGCVILGCRFAPPAVFAGLFLGTWMSTGLSSEATLRAVAVCVGAGAGALWFTRLWRGDPALLTMRDFFRFAVAGCLGCAGVITVILVAADPARSSAAQIWDHFQAQCLGVLVFGTFSVFVFRRQDLRPPDLRGAYEMLLYSSLLAWCIYFLLVNPMLGGKGFLLVTALCFLLVLLVSLRFGLRPLALFLVMFVFLIPAFVVMFPDRVHLAAVVARAEHTLHDPGLPALLGTLGCLLVGAFRDELKAVRIKFDLAMASAEMGVWEWSRPGWSFHTENWCRKFGLDTRRPVRSEEMLALVHPDDQPAFAERILALRREQAELWEHTYRLRDTSGKWCWVQSRAQMLQKTADDDVAVVAGITRDVTRERDAVQARIDVIENLAELRTLRSQLNPHFLFNSLNSVRALIGRDDPRARSMITALSNLLRELLAMRGDISHPLARELEIVDTYLEIESIRFGERLVYEIDADPAAAHRLIPGMMIQTLVENAVKHGISRLERGGRIVVRVRIDPDDDSLRLSVLNDGPLSAPSGGFGLENTRRRIALATENLGSLSLIELPGPKVEATVVVPARTEQPADPRSAATHPQTPSHENPAPR